MKKKIFTFLVYVLCAYTIGNAQNEYPLLAQQYEANKAVIDALVLYPQDVRIAILELSKHPSLIVKMDKSQKISSSKFAEIIGKYSEGMQEQFYDLSRYPGLIKIILIEKPNSDLKWKKVLGDYPDEIHNTAKQLGSSEISTLRDIDLLNEETQASWNNLLKQYPANMSEQVTKLTESPEVISMLSENIDLVILVADVYEKNPEWILNKADSMHVAVATENANAMEAWANELENDPDAMAELEQAAKDYAVENNYDDEDFNKSETETTVNVIYTYRPYYYWYGYPYWHSSAWWYPYPYWYHWGFYYSYPGTVIIIGLPSYHFSWWFLHHHHHWHHYPHLMHHVFHHHYTHNRTNVGLHAAVQSWEKDNVSIVGKDWLKNKNTRMDRIKEYATFTKNYAEYNRSKPNEVISKEEYLNIAKGDYPSMQTPKIKPVKEVKQYDGKTNYPKTKSDEVKSKSEIKTPPVTKTKPKYYPEKKHPKAPTTQPKKTYYPKKEIKVPEVSKKRNVNPVPKERKVTPKGRGGN